MKTKLKIKQYKFKNGLYSDRKNGKVTNRFTFTKSKNDLLTNYRLKDSYGDTLTTIIDDGNWLNIDALILDHNEAQNLFMALSCYMELEKETMNDFKIKRKK